MGRGAVHKLVRQFNDQDAENEETASGVFIANVSSRSTSASSVSSTTSSGKLRQRSTKSGTDAKKKATRKASARSSEEEVPDDKRKTQPPRPDAKAKKWKPSSSRNNNKRQDFNDYVMSLFYSLFGNAHVVFALGAVAFKLALPRLLALLAAPALIGFLSLYFPLFCTIAVVYQYKEQKQQDAAERNGRFIRPSRKSMLLSMEETFQEEMLDWLRFWVVRASVEALKTLLFSWLSIPRDVLALLRQAELVAYLWIYLVPFLQSESGVGAGAPEKRPLRLLCQHFLGPQSLQLVELAAGAIPVEWWQTHVVGTLSRVLNALVVVNALSPETEKKLLQATQEGRSLVLPALTLMAPGFLTQYGVVYVKYLLTIAKSFGGVVNGNSTYLWLQYWVLHACVDTVLYGFVPMLAWVPFFTHSLFCLWYYLSLPPVIEKWYGEIENELKSFGVLPSQGGGAAEVGGDGIEQTKTAKFLAQLWEMLPKAEDADAMVLDLSSLTTTTDEKTTEKKDQPEQDDDDDDEDNNTKQGETSPVPAEPEPLKSDTSGPSPEDLSSTKSRKTLIRHPSSSAPSTRRKSRRNSSLLSPSQLGGLNSISSSLSRSSKDNSSRFIGKGLEQEDVIAPSNKEPNMIVTTTTGGSAARTQSTTTQQEEEEQQERDDFDDMLDQMLASDDDDDGTQKKGSEQAPVANHQTELAVQE